MNASAKLNASFDYLFKSLKNKISSYSIDTDLVRFKISLKNAILIYVSYNNYDEYSYVIQFSPDPLDRMIVDNYDKKWNVESNPHHIHPRHLKEAIQSEFTGIPIEDMERLTKYILPEVK